MTMNGLAALYDKQENFDETEPLYVECLNLRKEVLTDTHPDTLRTMNNLAVMYCKQRKYTDLKIL